MASDSRNYFSLFPMLSGIESGGAPPNNRSSIYKIYMHLRAAIGTEMVGHAGIQIKPTGKHSTEPFQKSVQARRRP